MNKKMFLKNLVSLLLALVTLFVIFPQSASAADNTADSFWAFIADDAEGNEWKWDELGININDYQSHYVYSKNLSTGTITLLLNERAQQLYQYRSFVYCITETNKLIFIDIVTNETTHIKTFDVSPSVIVPVIAPDHCTLIGLYVVCDCDVYFVNHPENSIVLSASIKGIRTLRAIDSSHFVWENQNGQKFLRNTSSGTDTAPIDKPSDSFPSSPISERAFIKIFENNEYSLGKYTAGTYFSDYRTPCSHHKTPACHDDGSCDCYFYGTGIQCWGFAMYAYDQYSHKKSWEKIPGDYYPNQRNFSSSEELAKIFKTIPSSGFCIRFKDRHSLFVENVTSEGITGYECNTLGNCNIRQFHYTYEDLVSDFLGSPVEYVYSHKYNGNSAESDGPGGHIIYCASSGCSGYIYEPHYTLPYISQTGDYSLTCELCGYTGSDLDAESNRRNVAP